MRQQALFVRELPHGFIFQPDFLTVQEEQGLLAFMDSLPFYEFKLQGVAAKRRVIHFGLRYALATRVLSTAPEILAQLLPIQARAAALAGVSPADFSQLLINKYPPGAGIGWHHDSPPFGPVWNRRGNFVGRRLHHALPGRGRESAQNRRRRAASSFHLFANRRSARIVAASHRPHRRFTLLHHAKNPAPQSWGSVGK